MSRPPSREITAELERQAWKLRTHFWSHEDIANALHVSEEAVARMLQRVGEKPEEVYTKFVDIDMERFRNQHIHPKPEPQT